MSWCSLSFASSDGTDLTSTPFALFACSMTADDERLRQSLPVCFAMTVNLCDERTLHSNFHACNGTISAKLCDYCAYETAHMHVDGDLNRNC